MSKSDKFENPFIYTILSYEFVKASFGLIGLLLLISFISKTKVKNNLFALIFLYAISCGKNPIEPKKGEINQYRVQINKLDGIDTGIWYWKIEGKTDSGYSIATKPLSIKIE